MSDLPTFHAERIEKAHARLDAHEARLGQLERDSDVSAERYRTIQKALEGIQSSLTKGVWIVLGALITAILTFVFKGGLLG